MSTLLKTIKRLFLLGGPTVNLQRHSVDNSVRLQMSARKRRRIVDDEEEEEEEEEKEGMTRRLRARKKHQVRHNENDDEDDDDDDDDDDGHCSQNTHTYRTPEKNLMGNALPVTCGDKKGMLDAAKLAEGEKCIESEGLWYTPQAFERYGGKSSNKKWKQSILYENQHLQVLLENDVLTTPGHGNERTHTEKKKILSSDQESESSSEESEPLEQSVDRENSRDVDWLPNSQDAAQEQAEQRSQGSQGSEGEDSDAEDETERGEDRLEEDGSTKRKPDDDDDDDSIGVPKGRRTKRILTVSLKRLSEDKTAPHSDCSEPPGVGLYRSSPAAPDRESSGEEEDRRTSANRQSGDSGDTTETASTHSADNLTPHSPDRPVSRTRRTKETSEETSRERLPRSPGASHGRETDAPALSRPAACSDVDTMSLRELKEEKLKMQLKVLRLQEEYYSIQIHKHKL
ncbi:uncharacterized protein LOC143014255 isoform X2 [Genypterus blacodes]|uniref:uncharacterized protein LOC143014255 isoform X2 n=1 Tax=Genypterus blacodes TaxID=154954 RepID=UPI003F75F071